MGNRNRRKARNCRHAFEKFPLPEVIVICDFYEPEAHEYSNGHRFREAEYRCDKCGREVCHPCFEDMTAALNENTQVNENMEHTQGESEIRYRGPFLESLMNDQEIEAHKEPSYEEVMLADGEGDPHGLYSAKVWNMSDSNKPAGALYIGRAGRGEAGKWGNPFSLTKPLDAGEVAKICERLPEFAEMEYVRVGSRLTRQQSLDLYREYLVWALKSGHLEVRELVEETEYGLRVREQVCFCAPKPCHGHQLRDLAASYAFYRNERDYDHKRSLETAIYVHRGLSA